MRLLQFILLFVFQVLSVAVLGQKHRLKFQHLTTEQGLSQSTINCIRQDSHGFIWVGTRDGLNKYDGYSFTVYKNDLKDPHSLSNNYIADITEDKAGNLWITTGGGGLNRFDRITEQFTHFIHDKNNPNSLASNLTISLLLDSQGYLWIATQDGGLDRFDPQTQRFTHYTHDSHDAHSLGSNFVRDVLEDHQHRLWVATVGGGLNLLNRKTNTFTRYQHETNNPTSLSNNDVWALLEDSQHQLWVGTYGGGLDQFNPQTGQFRHFKAEPGNRQSLAQNVVLSLAEDPEGDLWVGTESGGLSILHSQTETFKSYVHDDIDNTSLSSNSVHCIYPDIKGNLWVGTFAGGINLLNRDANKFTHYKHTSEANSLIHNGVYPISEDWQGNIWIGTDGGGLDRFNPKTGEFRHYQHQAGNVNSICGNTVISILEDTQRNLWIGTWGDGLTIFNPEKNTYQHHKHEAGNPASLNSNNIWSIFEDREGRVWVGSYFGTGMDLYDRQTGRFTHYRTDPKDAKSISSGNIFTIAQDRKGDLWIGTDGAGVDQFDPQRGTFTHFQHKVNQNSLSDNTVYCIYEDKAGDLWFGTNKGLNQLNRKTNQFTVYTTEAGLSNDVVVGILADPEGNLWLSTNKGLSRFNPQAKSFKNFMVADGLQSSEFKPNAYCKTRSGTMYFGGINGFNEFNPQEIKENPFDPPVVITDFQIFNKQVLFGKHANSLLRQPISDTKEIILSYKESVFSFQFASLNYTSPGKKQYSYRLVGFDKDWNYVGTQRTATYTNLDAGEYVFQVRGLDNQGRWSTKITSVKISITPPFWVTWWAYALYGVVIMMIAFLVRTIVKKQILLKEELQAAQLLSAKTGLEKLKDKEINEMKFRFFTNVSHELKTPLTLIISPLEELLMLKDVSKHFREKLLLMHRHSGRLLTMIHQLLDLRKADSGNMRLQTKQQDIVKFIFEVFESFNHLAARRKITYSFHSEIDQLLVDFDENKIEMAVTNILSNAFKYVPDSGKICCFIAIEKDALLNKTFCNISVQDTGRGMPKEALDKIFDLYYQVAVVDSVKISGTGIGLSIVKEIVQLHSGLVTVESEVGKGSKFSIKLPLKEMSSSGDVLSLGQGQAKTPDEVAPRKEIPEEEKPLLLIIEDTDELRNYVSDLLHDEFHVLEASSGEDGLKCALEKIPDIIISDIMMEKLDGLEVCNKLKNNVRTCHIPVILLTAKNMPESELSGLDAGADDYIKKPFNPIILIARIRRLLDSRKYLKEYYSKKVTLQPTNVEITHYDEKFLQKGMAYIEANLLNPDLSAESLGYELGMSYSTLYRKLKALTGQSVNEFMRSIRIKRAAQLLQTGQYTVSEAAFQTGFSEVKYFRNYFKDQFGCLPSEYSKANNETTT